MPRRFRELAQPEKASHSVTEDTSDDAFVYCPSCGRAMHQGDCIVDDALEEKLRCAYDDCILDANIAMHSLHAWDAYRELYKEETVDWPEVPIPGECYKP